MVPCVDLFDAVNQELDYRQESARDNNLCLNPDTTTLEGVEAYELVEFISVAWMDCKDDTSIGSVEVRAEYCLDQGNITQWFKETNVKDDAVAFFHAYNFIDLSDKMSAKKEGIQILKVDTLAGVRMTAEIKALVHEVHLDDDIWNPLAHKTSDTRYMSLGDPKYTVESGNEDEEDDTRLITLEFDIKLSNDLKIEERRRYQFWDLIGDVGGFNDGIYALAGLLFNFYSALAFKADLLRDNYVDTMSN